MKIVNIQGGLGNQMFQYAFYLALQEVCKNEIVKVDVSYIATYGRHNGLELERVFGIKLDRAIFKDLIKVTYPVYNYQLHRILRKIIPLRKSEVLDKWENLDSLFERGDKYFDGYWQNYRLFHPIIEQKVRDVFKIILPLGEQNLEFLSKTEKKNTVSIHIRRGDYLKEPLYLGICDLDYYKTAINHMKRNVESPIFVVFSNDIDWCKCNIVPLFEGSSYFIIDWNSGVNSAIDLYLMSKCKHNIIANSSFSWWGAYLNENENKIVCSPKKWANTSNPQYRQLSDWFLI